MSGDFMTTKVQAIYRNGAFLPATPVPVAEGAEVELTVTVNGESSSLAEGLEEIARLPMEGPRDGFSGADHDRILYGSRTAK
jgi:predicted DNA-binding antitoxin AbrB/MazE fold protein